MGTFPSSMVFFAIHGVLYPASIVTNSTVYLRVTSSYNLSHATLSWTFPAVTSAASINPLPSQAVWASYANCRSCSPFTNIPLSGSVVDAVFSAFFRLPGDGGSLLSVSSSSSSIGFFPKASRSALTSLRSCPEYTFAVFRTCSFWNFFLFALALICVPSMKTVLGSTIRLLSALLRICSKISVVSSSGKRLQKA